MCELSVFYWDSFRESVECSDWPDAVLWLRDNWGRLGSVSGCCILYDSDGEILRSLEWSEGSEFPLPGVCQS